MRAGVSGWNSPPPHSVHVAAERAGTSCEVAGTTRTVAGQTKDRASYRAM